MDGTDFVNTLKRLNFPSANELNSDNYDWMFDCDTAKSFLNWFCGTLGKNNLLDSQQIELFEELKKPGGTILEGEALEKALLDQKKVKTKSQIVSLSDEEEDQDIYEQDSSKITKILERKICILESKIKVEDEEHQRLICEQNIVKSQLIKSEKENQHLDDSFKNSKILKDLSDLKTSDDIKNLTNTLEELKDNIKLLLTYFDYNSSISDSQNNQDFFYSQLDFKHFLLADEDFTRVLTQQYGNLLNTHTTTASAANVSNQNMTTTYGIGASYGAGVGCNGGSYSSKSSSAYVSSRSSSGIRPGLSSTSSNIFSNNSSNDGDKIRENENQFKNVNDLELELVILEKTLFKSEFMFYDEQIKMKIKEKQNSQKETQKFNLPVTLEELNMKASSIGHETDKNKILEQTHRIQMEELLQNKCRLEVELIAAGSYDSIIKNHELIFKKYDKVIANMATRDSIRSMLKCLMIEEMKKVVMLCSCLSVINQHLTVLTDFLNYQNTKQKDTSDKITFNKSNKVITTNQNYLQLIHRVVSLTSSPTKYNKEEDQLFVTHKDLLNEVSLLNSLHDKKNDSEMTEMTTLHRDTQQLSKELKRCVCKQFQPIMDQLPDVNIQQEVDPNLDYNFLPHAIFKRMSDLSYLLKDLEGDVTLIVKEIESKEMTLKSDEFMTTARKVPLYFYTSPDKLRDSVEMLKNKLKITRTLKHQQ